MMGMPWTEHVLSGCFKKNESKMYNLNQKETVDILLKHKEESGLGEFNTHGAY